MMALLLFASIVLQFFGTVFVWFDTEHMSDVIRPGRIVLTDDAKWKKWYYGKSKYGFALIFAGIVLQGVLALMAHGCR
jgi:hypothetical protein